jgi:uncharacterized membrane protein HdeD (DUF308 family)
MNESQPLIPTAVWLALFPLTYLIHFAEEYWGGEGYPAYLLRLRGVHLSRSRFVLLEIAGFLFIVVGAFLAYQLKFPEFMIALLGALVLANGISHSVTAIRDGRYGPGLFSSALVWLPLGILTLVMMFGHMSNVRFAIAVLVGFAIQGIVALIALFSGNRQ